jgi:hypothetical protein
VRWPSGDVAIGGLVISSEKYRLALASRPLKEENFGNFFRETGAASGNMRRDAGRDEAPPELSKGRGREENL